MAKGKKKKRDTIRDMETTDDSRRVLELLAEAEAAERPRPGADDAPTEPAERDDDKQ